MTADPEKNKSPSRIAAGPQQNRNEDIADSG